MTDRTNTYYKNFDEIENRLDFIYYHPELDIVNNLDKITGYKVLNVSDFVTNDDLCSGSTPRNINYNDDNEFLFLGSTNIQNDILDQASTRRTDARDTVGDTRSTLAR